MEQRTEQDVSPHRVFSRAEWATLDNPARLQGLACYASVRDVPGPVDVAWDLVGAVVEWELGGATREALLERYARISGDRGVRGRLPAYVRAYGVAHSRCVALGGLRSLVRRSAT